MQDLYHVRGCAHKPVGQAACPCHACSSTCSPLGQAQAHPWLGRTQAASSPQSRTDFPLSDPTREPVGSGGDKFAWGQAAEWGQVPHSCSRAGSDSRLQALQPFEAKVQPTPDRSKPQRAASTKRSRAKKAAGQRARMLSRTAPSPTPSLQDSEERPDPTAPSCSPPAAWPHKDTRGAMRLCRARLPATFPESEDKALARTGSGAGSSQPQGCAAAPEESKQEKAIEEARFSFMWVSAKVQSRRRLQRTLEKFQ